MGVILHHEGGDCCKPGSLSDGESELFPTEECLKKMRVNKRNKIKTQEKYPEGQGSDSLRYQPITYKSRQKLCNFTHPLISFNKVKKTELKRFVIRQ